MFRSRLAAFASLATLAIAVPCDAQFVRIGGWGGVSVRAPFVSVDVAPYGGTRVVAPFTSVYSYGPVVSYRRAVVGVPSFPPLPPFAVVPAVPAYPFPLYQVPAAAQVVYEDQAIPAQGYQVTRPSVDGHVAEDLRRAAIRFQYSMSLRHDGDVWLDYLGPARIVSAIEQGAPPSSLADLIKNFDGVVANRNLRAIYNASGFNETRELLRVYVDMQPAGPQVSPPRAASPPEAPQPAVPVDPAAEDAEDIEALPAPNPRVDDANADRPTPAPPAANPPAANPPGANLPGADDPTDL